MVKPIVFVDGEYGTTGLKILLRLKDRADISLISLPYSQRHNVEKRSKYLKNSDFAILCLPDAAAREAVTLLKGKSSTRILDASSSYRTDPDWVYGFAELIPDQKKRIQSAMYVSNPGCYATGALSIIRPLREFNFIKATDPITIRAISGYTGGGKKLISEMKNAACPPHYFLYSLHGNHKHLPEIMTYGLLSKPPNFLPSVGYFPQGMLVSLSLFFEKEDLHFFPSEVENLFRNYYKNSKQISIASLTQTNAMDRLYPENLLDPDALKIYIFTNPDVPCLNIYAQLDNLGKGAAGAAVQNLNIMLSGH